MTNTENDIIILLMSLLAYVAIHTLIYIQLKVISSKKKGKSNLYLKCKLKQIKNEIKALDAEMAYMSIEDYTQQHEELLNSKKMLEVDMWKNSID